jgi:hypothetical protein
MLEVFKTGQSAVQGTVTLSRIDVRLVMGDGMCDEVLGATTMVGVRGGF